MPRIIPSQSFSSDELAQALGENPKRIRAAVALMRTGDADLIDKVINGDMTVDAALRMARAAKAQI
jgi:hypothetical protein